jgi:acyl-CoA thioesterase II
MKLRNDLIDHLKMQRDDNNSFTGHSRFSPNNTHVFGGQILGQGLSAACQTAMDRHCHAMNCYFLRPFDFKLPIEYRVTRNRDGGSFSHRQVSAHQAGRECMRMEASFQKETQGFEHSPIKPAVPDPEDLPPYSIYQEEFEKLNRRGMYKFLVEDNAFEFRCMETPCYIETRNRPPVQQTWVRSRYSLPTDPWLQLSALAFISDNNFMRTVTLPHREELMASGFQLATLNHSMWFHRVPDLNDWLLYNVHSSVACNERGMVIGHFYTRGGQLVATAAQEGMMRIMTGDKSNNQFSEMN